MEKKREFAIRVSSLGGTFIEPAGGRDWGVLTAHVWAESEEEVLATPAYKELREYGFSLQDEWAGLELDEEEAWWYFAVFVDGDFIGIAEGVYEWDALQRLQGETGALRYRSKSHLDRKTSIHRMDEDAYQVFLKAMEDLESPWKALDIMKAHREERWERYLEEGHPTHIDLVALGQETPGTVNHTSFWGTL